MLFKVAILERFPPGTDMQDSDLVKEFQMSRYVYTCTHELCVQSPFHEVAVDISSQIIAMDLQFQYIGQLLLNTVLIANK